MAPNEDNELVRELSTEEPIVYVEAAAEVAADTEVELENAVTSYVSVSRSEDVHRYWANLSAPGPMHERNSIITLGRARFSPDGLPRIDGVGGHVVEICENIRISLLMQDNGFSYGDREVLAAESRKAALASYTIIAKQEAAPGPQHVRSLLATVVGMADCPYVAESLLPELLQEIANARGNADLAISTYHKLTPSKQTKELPRVKHALAYYDVLRATAMCLKYAMSWVSQKKNIRELDWTRGLALILSMLQEMYEPGGSSSALNSELPGNSDADAEQLKELAEALGVTSLKKGDFIPKNTNDATWGDLDVVPVPLELSAPGQYYKYKTKYSDQGVMPVAWHRYAVDQKVFADHKRQHITPTLLIDCSGSMSWSDAQLTAVVKEFPFAKVATYGGVTESRGVLHVICENHRMAQSQYFKSDMSGANLVDGPALEWLGTQPAPRVWISDGHVTGRGDSQNPLIIASAFKSCVDHNIFRAGNAQAAITHLRKCMAQLGKRRVRTSVENLRG